MEKNNVSNCAKNQLVPLSRSEASKIYSEEKVLEYANKFVLNRDIPEDSKDFKKLKLVKFFAYFNAENEIDTCAVRFEDQHGKKHVLTYWYNGKNLKMQGYKILIYGRNLLAKYPDKPVIIHEGEKCADIGNEELTDFVNISWNGGGKKWDLIEGLEILKGREVFLLPDDDQMKTAVSKDVFPPWKQPGMITMHGLKVKLEKIGVDAFLLGVFPEARAIKESGADIEEILKIFSPKIITEEILKAKEKKDSIFVDDLKAEKIIKKTAAAIIENKENKEDGTEQPKKDDKEDRQGNRGDGKGNREIGRRGQKERKKNDGLSCTVSDGDNHTDNSYPFEILGIADDGRAYFLDYENRMISYELDTLTPKKLISIGGLQFFKNAYGGDPLKSFEWDQEIDSIMQISKRIDFNLENCRGRGAWKDDQGRICYHDGQKTTGKFDPEWTFLRKPKRDIGINSTPCDAGTRAEIMRIAKKFSFATPADAVRLLSHAAVSPFGGALFHRTAILATGESAWGKSTVVDKVAKPISGTLKSYGGNSSEAGIRQHNANDSGSIFIDEAETKRPKDRERIEDIFDLMRSSTSDDSPVTAKGSISGKVSIFTMKSMFCFVSINASVDNAANDNRIIRVNFKRPDNASTYKEDLRKIKALLTKENCDGIRSFVWKNLKEIIELGERLELIIQDATKQDARFAAGESILIATNLIVWENWNGEITDEDLTNYVKEFYKNQTQEAKRDEITEMINRLLDETVYFGPERDRLSIRFMLVEMKKFLDWKDKQGESLSLTTTSPGIIIYDVYKAYKKSVEQFGLTVYPKKRELAIAQNHHEIMKILQIGKGYQRQLERHKNLVLAKHNITIDAGAKTCTVIGGFLEYEIEGGIA